MAEQRYPSQRTTAVLDERPLRNAAVSEASGEPADPYADEPRYPAWKVSLFVIAVCGAFWAGVSYLAMRLLG